MPFHEKNIVCMTRLGETLFSKIFQFPHPVSTLVKLVPSERDLKLELERLRHKNSCIITFP